MEAVLAELVKANERTNETLSQMQKVMAKLEERDGDRQYLRVGDHSDDETKKASADNRRRRMTTKDLDVKTFDGNVEEWESWAHVFRRSVRAADPDAYDLLIEAEGKSDVIDEEEKYKGPNRQRSAELYDILCKVTGDEGLSVVRTVEDCHGFEAWRKLVKRFNPRTMARIVRSLLGVTGPAKIVKIEDVEKGMNAWEEKLKRMMKLIPEQRFGNELKIALLAEMLPTSLQEHLFTDLKDNSKYEDVAHRIRLLVSNKVASHAMPMDMGYVWGQTPPGL